MNKDKKTLRVCMITGTFPPYYGGGGRQAYSLCHHLKRQCVEPFVLTRNTTQQRGIRDMQEIVDDIPVFRLACQNTSRLKLPYALRVLVKLIRFQHSYEIIHCHGAFGPAYVGVILSKILNKPFIVKIVTCGVDDPEQILHTRFGMLRLKILSHADGIVCISSEISKKVRQFPFLRDKVLEIPNGVDINLFKPATSQQKIELRKALAIPVDAPIISLVGIVKWKKGIDLLIQAWKQVAHNNPAGILYLVGPNDESGMAGNVSAEFVRQIQSEIEHAGLSQQVTFTGQVDCPSDYLRASDIFVFPSRREGLPNALLEAMACGLPCLASDLECHKDLVTHETDGLLFEQENSAQLAMNLQRLLGSEKLRQKLGHNARLKILDIFSLEKVSNQYVFLYQSLLGVKR